MNTTILVGNTMLYLQLLQAPLLNLPGILAASHLHVPPLLVHGIHVVLQVDQLQHLRRR